jgi:manganese transport system ATP-binding protein
MSAAIEVAGLTVHYGEILALDDVSLAVPAGQVCGLIGMNGSGKSTLFKSLVGLVRPGSGEVRLAGGTVAEARKQGLVAYVPQNEEVDWAFPISVREVVMTGRYGHQGFTRRPRRADRLAVAEALERVGLAELAGRQIGRLSGGQRKRAFVARAMAQEAEVLLLDEPFAGVDKGSEAMIVQLLRELAAGGATALVSTHDLHALPSLAAESVLLKQRVLLHGPTAEVLRPENLALAFGIGISAAEPASAAPPTSGAPPASAAPPGATPASPAPASGSSS